MEFAFTRKRLLEIRRLFDFDQFDPERYGQQRGDGQSFAKMPMPFVSSIG
jgi:hypothetical protein